MSTSWAPWPPANRTTTSTASSGGSSPSAAPSPSLSVTGIAFPGHAPGIGYPQPGQHGALVVGVSSSFFFCGTGKETNCTGRPARVTTVSEARKSATCDSRTRKRISSPSTLPERSK
jgi:hypothetical protein